MRTYNTPIQALLYYIRHTLSSIKLIIKRKLNEIDPQALKIEGVGVWSKCRPHTIEYYLYIHYFFKRYKMETLSITNCPTSDCNSKKIYKIKWKPYDEQLYRCRDCKTTWSKSTRYCNTCKDVAIYCKCYEDFF